MRYHYYAHLVGEDAVLGYAEQVGAPPDDRRLQLPVYLCSGCPTQLTPHAEWQARLLKGCPECGAALRLLGWAAFRQTDYGVEFLEPLDAATEAYFGSPYA